MNEIAFTGARLYEVSFQVIEHLAHPGDYLAEISTREESR